MKLKILICIGRKIGLFTLPFLIAGLILNILYPANFSVNGPSNVLNWLSLIILVAGVTIRIWSVVLILTKIPRKELITTGSYILVRSLV